MTQLGILAVAAVAALLAGTTNVQASAADESHVLKRIKERGVINVGHREASIPFSYLGEDGKPQGYSVDLCMKIIDRVKAVLKIPNLKVKFVTVTAQTRIPMMVDGKIDIECGSTTNNLTRQNQVDYLAVTFITGTKLASKIGSGIEEIEDMSGKVVAVALGTTNEKSIKRVAKERGIKVNFLMVKDHSEGWRSLETGRADAYATDDVLLFGLISKSEYPDQFQVTGRFLSYEPYGIMVPRNDSAYRRIGNMVLADLMRSGEATDIYDKWFNPGPTRIKMPMSSTLETAFEIQALPY